MFVLIVVLNSQYYFWEIYTVSLNGIFISSILVEIFHKILDGETVLTRWEKILRTFH